MNQHSDMGHRLDTLWLRLVNIAEEMTATLFRTGFSPEMISANDVSAAVFDREGRMIAQTQLGAPGHLGAMPYFMEALLRQWTDSEMRPGDAFITNDPWLQSGHTSDIYVAAPAFSGSTLVGFVVTSAHNLDIGGRAGSGMSEEVYEEGLLLPILPLVKAGRENAELISLIRRNVRFDNKVVGDLRAQVAACRVGAQKLIEVADQAAPATLQDLAREVIERTEAGMRSGIAALEDGEHSGETTFTVDGLLEPVVIKMRLTKAGDEVSFDFDGTSREVRRPVNCPMNFVRAYLVLALKMVCNPEIPNNAGVYRPVGIRAPLGTVVNPRYPAPTYWRYVTGLMAADLGFRLLASVAPQRVPAGSGSVPIWQYYVHGVTNDGALFASHSHAFGGMGARFGRDGLSAIAFPMNVRDVPTEEVEADSPLIVWQRELITDSGGPGRWRGGLGERMTLELRPGADVRPGNSTVLHAGIGRLDKPAIGLFGGGPGRLGKLLVNGAPIAPAASPEVRFGPGDLVTFELPGGGGYGDPRERDRGLVDADLADGYVSAEQVTKTYGREEVMASDPVRATGQ